jgi:hypothetical protein
MRRRDMLEFAATLATTTKLGCESSHKATAVPTTAHFFYPMWIICKRPARDELRRSFIPGAGGDGAGFPSRALRRAPFFPFSEVIHIRPLPTAEGKSVAST